MTQTTKPTTVATVDLCVPVHDGLHKIDTIEIEGLLDDYGTPIEGHITALLNGRPEDNGARVMGVVLNRSGEIAKPKAAAPDLCEQIRDNVPISEDSIVRPDEEQPYLDLWRDEP